MNKVCNETEGSDRVQTRRPRDGGLESEIASACCVQWSCASNVRLVQAAL